MEQDEAEPHVLMFPFPALGHINPMLKLAELLSLSGLRITFLNVHRFHHKLTLSTDIQSRFSRFPKFRFETITDGLPADYSGGLTELPEFALSLEAVTKPLLRHMLVSGQLGPIPTCIILDGFFSFMVDANAEPKIPVFCFRANSACAFWTYSSFPRLIEDGQLPVRGEGDMDRMIQGVAGIENVIRCRDLPSFSRVGDQTDPILEYSVTQTVQSTKAYSLILNTFEDLEGPILSCIRTLCANVYTIGPLHAHLKSRHSNEKSPPESESCNGFWEADRSCLAWLDAQPSRSVVYVSFGSVTVMKDEQFMEFWHGLVDSGRRFLWVVRPNMVGGKDGENGMPVELEEGTKERGFMVGWAPQEEVLSHEAIGGFLSHSGWNSTMESIVAGVPMICWPQFADQPTNSRFVSEVWRIGVDMKDLCDRKTVAKMVNDVMEFRRDELMASIIETANLAKRSVEEGGSSFCDFDRMVNDIRLLSTQPRKSHD